MVVIGKAKSDGSSSSSGSNDIGDDGCGKLSKSKSSWITNAEKTILFQNAKSKSRDIPICQASVLHTLIFVCGQKQEEQWLTWF